jgi:hypothetical protein
MTQKPRKLTTLRTLMLWAFESVDCERLVVEIEPLLYLESGVCNGKRQYLVLSPALPGLGDGNFLQIHSE